MKRDGRVRQDVFISFGHQADKLMGRENPESTKLTSLHAKQARKMALGC
jgi:hypothetical protein